MRIDIGIKKRKEKWHQWFVWHPIVISKNYGLQIIWLQYIYRKWIPSQCYGHFGNYIYRLKTKD